MWRFATGAVLAAGLVSSAATGVSAAVLSKFPTALNAVFDGALISTYADGAQAKLWLSRDGGFTARGIRGERNAGRWSVEGQKVCLRQTRPIPLPLFQYCTGLPGRLTYPWRAASPSGDLVTVRFVAGDRP